MKDRLRLFVNLCCFPLFFLVNGINENYGLIPLTVFGSLLVKYMLVTAVIATVSFLVISNPRKAFIMALSGTALYFLFGSLHDTVKQWKIIQPLMQYRILLPLLLLATCLFFMALKRSKGSFQKVTGFLGYFNVILLSLSLLVLLFKFVTHAERKVDFGDLKNELAQQTGISESQPEDPTIFWLVFDMYPSSVSLKSEWNFNNPLDSILKGKGFYVAPYARSNYNYTHYSLTSIMDMSYLRGFGQGDVVTAKDQERGWSSLYENNVVDLLEKRKYRIRNFSLFDLKGHPTEGVALYKPQLARLIDRQTFFSRVGSDIGWNLYSHNNILDSSLEMSSLQNVDSIYRNYIQQVNNVVSESTRQDKAAFFMIHMLLPHEPFIYNEEGRLVYHRIKNDKKDFLPQLVYTNKVVEQMVDNILKTSGKKDIIIILQGDHGYKFEETDQGFDRESCKIFFAVYDSKRSYGPWYPELSGVNIFRILFNQQFGTSFPLLKDSSILLRYRQNK